MASVLPAHFTDHAAMKNTQEPPFGTPEYEMIDLERIVSTAGEGHEGVSAFLTATVTFAGDGDVVPGSGCLPAGRRLLQGPPGTDSHGRELDHLHR